MADRSHRHDNHTRRWHPYTRRDDGNSIGDRARQQRAATQRILLLGFRSLSSYEFRFEILGSSRSEYEVVFRRLDQPESEVSYLCTCPDFERRLRCCKHIYFVFRILGLQEHGDHISSRVTSRAIIAFQQRHGESRERMLHTAIDKDGCEISTTPPTLSSRKPNQILVVAAKDIAENEECAICFELLQPSASVTEPLVFCQAQCGRSLHRSCLERAFRAATSRRCPLCRATWLGPC